ncbi:unnamed protein product [Cladocopium goreaui]|uniref:Trafficking protein particle complex subunit 6B (TRAPP complex subunit 6B) n=1 Tax=Cladocopium goreaui TaxID=2562237 RepID=A0A9P1GHB5_9DINO|nr:unnamed protein product [Cladocopium goreaui]
MAESPKGYPERPPLIGPGTGAALPERLVSNAMYTLLHAQMVVSLRDTFGPDGAEDKLRRLGFTTGVRLITRLAGSRFPMTNERMIMKYVCKELWTYLFHQPASRLQADKHGGYIIIDHSFRWLEGFAGSSSEVSETQQLALLHLALPCGLLQGVPFAELVTPLWRNIAKMLQIN